ncbi:MAG: hypothetical protein EON92_17455, partial [Burkholderiales bacterium]
MTPIAAPLDPLAQRLQTIQKLIASGKLPEAATKLNVAAKAVPGDARVFLMGMRLAEASGNAAGALDAARRAVNLAPEWPVAVTELAFLLALHPGDEEVLFYKDVASGKTPARQPAAMVRSLY